MKVLGDMSKVKKNMAAASDGEHTDAASTDDDGDDDNSLESMETIGCTANVVLLNFSEKKIFVANAGDSRCVMGRGGKAVPLSFDHKPEEEEEIRRIEAAGSVVIEGRVDGNLNLTRALGDLKYKQKPGLKPEEYPITANPDLYEYPLTDDCDFIIMGCDGVWEKKTNDEMVAWVYDKLGDNPAEADLQKIVSDLLNELVAPSIAEN